MTQLDLFSLSAPSAAAAKKVEPLQEGGDELKDQTTSFSSAQHQQTTAQNDMAASLNTEKEDVEDLDGNRVAQQFEKTSEVLLSAVEKAIIKNLERRVPEVAAPLKGTNMAASERTGDIVFEDSRITVKIKNRPANSEDGSPAKKPEPRKSIVTRQPPTEFSLALNSKLNQLKSNIKQGLLNDNAEKKKKEKEAKKPQKRGRKSFKDIDVDADLVSIPDDEQLFSKQYYTIREVAGWFNVNTSLLRFWENEFDILKPRKNRKGDRLFRPEDVKNLQLIYQLLRQHKYSLEGAREYLKNNKGKADMQIQLTNTLQKFRSFLLEIKANLQ